MLATADPSAVGIAVVRPNASYRHASPLPPDVETRRFAESYVEVVVAAPASPGHSSPHSPVAVATRVADVHE
ncbi:hypothetical protein [Cellulomonas avistercoris]|uniref:hypothetical protein n=1 Tax=Cellulomonas avistercoris TaxID=2762242 RepID=UPI001CD8D4C5|nr:hypothetical protein [Cellulomonas avistercoris]